MIAMDVARDDMDLLVVTENGYGKRTQISQYRKTNRGAKGVKTIGLTEKKGALAGALVVREHQELVFISVGGMVQRTRSAASPSRAARPPGVRVMNLKDDDLVSAVALVVDTGEDSEDAGRGPPRTPRPSGPPGRGRGGRPSAARRPDPRRSAAHQRPRREPRTRPVSRACAQPPAGAVRQARGCAEPVRRSPRRPCRSLCALRPSLAGGTRRQPARAHAQAPRRGTRRTSRTRSPPTRSASRAPARSRTRRHARRARLRQRTPRRAPARRRPARQIPRRRDDRRGARDARARTPN